MLASEIEGPPPKSAGSSLLIPWRSEGKLCRRSEDPDEPPESVWNFKFGKKISWFSN